MVKQKIEQAFDILNELDIDLWLVIDKESELLTDPIMDYVVGTGVTWYSMFLYFKQRKKYAIVGNLDIEKFENLKLFDKVYAYKSSPKDFLFELLNKYKPNKIAIDYSVNSPAADGLTYGRYLELIELLKGSGYEKRLISAEEIISKLRGRKSEEEINRMKKAIDITLDIYDKVTEYAKPGMKEKDIANFITSERVKLGLEPSWEEEHCPSVFTGPQTVGAHSGPTSKELKRGHIFNIDFGVVYEKYCSDLQRTWYILRENETFPPDEVMRGFNTIVESIQLAFNALKPGVTGVEIDKIAREYIVSKGYDEYPHALGHQVGRSAHDGGALLGPAWDRYGNLPFIPLEENQVFTIEPRLYIKDYGVATIEEMVVIKKDGAKFLSPPQKEIFLVK